MVCSRHALLSWGQTYCAKTFRRVPEPGPYRNQHTAERLFGGGLQLPISQTVCVRVYGFLTTPYTRIRSEYAFNVGARSSEGLYTLAYRSNFSYNLKYFPLEESLTAEDSWKALGSARLAKACLTQVKAHSHYVCSWVHLRQRVQLPGDSGQQLHQQLRPGSGGRGAVELHCGRQQHRLQQQHRQLRRWALFPCVTGCLGRSIQIRCGGVPGRGGEGGGERR